MTKHFDSLEHRSPSEREAALFSELNDLLPRLVAHAPGWRKLLADHDLNAIKDRADLVQLPVLRKTDLQKMQQGDPPFAGLTTCGLEGYGRVFMSPGPIFEPRGLNQDPWRGARAMYAAGFRKGDLVHNAFAYHLTPGGFIMDSAARALGCAVIPAGVGNTDAQVDAIAQLKPNCYAGTPDYLKVLLDHAATAGKDARSITRGLVSGGALFPSLRQEYADRGVCVLQCYATADVGVIAYESEALDGMIVDEGVILEIVRPGTGDPVPDGEVGEVVITNFNPLYPMIRFGTGDLSAVLPGQSPCGRTNTRIKGWLGRADQTTKVKGMFVHPSQIAEISRRHNEIDRLRLEVFRSGEQDAMTLKVQASGHSPELRDAIAASMQAVCKLRGTVEFVGAQGLPNDGKVIDDQRTYE